jgi:propanol-preferring alcohol dehydrogenase
MRVACALHFPAVVMLAYVIDTHEHRGAVRQRSTPVPREGEVVVRVEACGLCRTDLHILDGELAASRPEVIPGHQVVGHIVEVGGGVEPRRVGQRVGLAWLAASCGVCGFCRTDRENLCPRARFTGLDHDGGMAELALARAEFALPVSGQLPATELAPLLCGGAIGYRSLRLAGPAHHLGIYGFGAAAHLVTQMARAQGREVYAFTRPGDQPRQAFAREVGAVWAGDSDQRPPEALDAAILFAAAGELVPLALAAVAPGGTVVCGEIHMSDIPSLPYRLLWQERVLRSVANVTRRDVADVLALAATSPIHPQVSVYPLADVERAIDDLRRGVLQGSAVVVP